MRKLGLALCLWVVAAAMGAVLHGQTAPAIDFTRARGLIQRQQAGETLSPEDQAYLQQARAERARLATQPADPGIDTARARALNQRRQAGETLSPEDQAYLDRALAMGRGPNAGAAISVPATRASTGLVPLTDLKADARYKGLEGGLYGQGSNEVPAELAKRAGDAARAIQPLDASGKPSAEGRIVLLSLGMSNTTQEFSRFKINADADTARNPRVVVVDGAQGGKDAAAWINPPQNQAVWDEAEKRIKAAGVNDAQVQSLWIKQALIQPASLGEFPRHTDLLAEDLHKTVDLAKERFPNLRLVFLSSRIYAGYATTALNPEPYAYEGAFAVRQAILGQARTGPVLLWGPYLWADGFKGRAGDTLVWKAEDFGPDGTHPADLGRAKVAGMLLDFFKSNAYAKGWFVKSN